MNGRTLELRHLRAFAAVSRTLSFTAAANELHYAQSSVSEQVQALEAELGTLLFERLGRRLQLTDAGHRLVGHAAQILSLVDQAFADVSSTDGPSGQLVAGGLETLCAHRLPSLLARYRQAFPQVEVSIRAGNRRELVNLVRSGDIDVAFMFAAPPAEAAVAQTVFAEERLVVVAPPDQALAGRKSVTKAELSSEPFLVTQEGCSFREMFESAFADEPTRPRIAAEVDSISAMSACVASGLACAGP